MSTLHEDRRFVADLARQGGAMAMEYFRRGIEPEFKAGDEPVTEADRAVNAFLVDALSTRFPDDAILAEESRPDPRRFDAGRTWMVDPIDGTREFIRGTDSWEVLVGLVAEGRPVLGVAYNAVNDMMLEASERDGAWISRDGDEPERFTAHAAGDDRLAVVIREGRRRGLTETLLRALAPTRVVEKAGLGARAVLAAQAEVDLVLNVGGSPREWDTCALEVILKEAGCEMVNCLGEPFTYLKPDPTQRHGLVIYRRDLGDGPLRKIAEIYRDATSD